MMGKSLYMLNRFEDWYLTGNRKPENVNVLICDIEGDFMKNFDSWSEEEREYKINLVYFMCAYGGGFPHATLQVKELTDEAKN